MFRAALCCLLLWPTAARADYPPVTDRNYAIELYDGVAIGNSAIVAMGGAAAANAMGTSGTLVNPSAPAVRPTTDTDPWSLDYHFDYLISTSRSDYDNNGIVSPNGGGTSLFTWGIGGRAKDWAFAATASYATSQIDGLALQAQTLHANVALATWVPQLDIAFGAALQIVEFDLEANCTGTLSCVDLFSINGAGLEAGATWIPRLRNFRAGGAISTRAIGGNVVADQCMDKTDCQGYILPNTVVSPGRFVGGIAYRLADTEWNQLVGGTFRDEPSLTIAADVVITAPSTNAFGLEAFAMHELQPTGTRWVFSPRIGAEYECLPGRLRLRAGSYFEPERFDGVHGRVHGTFGLELRALEFHAWGRRRGALTLTGDLAERFQNLGISIGFWH
jgi:hypothetical protein